MKSSIQIETTRCSSNSNSNTDSLNSQIRKLSDDNLSLKIQLDNLKQQNQDENERINAYKLENEKLKKELAKLLKESETNSMSKIELQNQIENYKNKLKFEEEQKEELRSKYETELNAAKIRYDNELEKQNMLMNNKYDTLRDEINQLNLLVNTLQQEKSDLINLIQREVTLRKEINEHKEAINRRIVEM